jgi:hypothetical protein
MLLAAYDEKNTFSLSLSGAFMRILVKYLQDDTLRKPSHLEVLTDDTNDNNYRIFELTPFENKPTIRIILFDAALAKKTDVRKYTQIDKPNLKIVFISAFQSASTGLNYFITYTGYNFEEDFERLVIINSPFYTDIIKDPNSEDSTLYSNSNFLLLMKHYSSSLEIKKLKDFSTNLIYAECYKLLMQEHSTEILKILLQTFGRTERKDSYIVTEIYLPDSLVNMSMLLFNKFINDKRNKTVLASMSLNCYKYKEFCLQRQKNYCFNDDVKRKEFENLIMDNSYYLDSLVEEKVPIILKQAQTGDKNAIKFNQAYRDSSSFSDPKKYIARLKETKLVKKDYCLSVLIL